ncbi:MAG: ABC transporter permease [Bacteroidetes bacterium]|nr:ABC transporter permease [Bacteroidota bacterium]
MILNRIKSTIKSFYNFKVYSSINLFGLVLGITCSAVIFLYVNFEYSFDNFHKDKDRIFRVNEITTSPKNIDNIPLLRAPYGPALKNEISEIEDVVRFDYNWHVHTLKFNDKVIALENAIFADSNLFSFFTFNILYGQPKQLLASKNSIVLTQKISNRLFGNENPLGKLVEYDSNFYVITGVVADVPRNSHIQFDAVFPMENLLKSPDAYVGWDGGISVTTFVKLFSSDLETNVEEKIPDFLWEKVNKKNKDAGFFTEFYLEPLNQIHLFSKVDWDSHEKDGKQVLILLFIGLLILVIAVINYLFISNGTLTLRLKEFSIKNYFGLGESGIAKQIFSDSLILFILSGIISVILISLLKSYISELFNVDFLSFQLKNNIFLLAIVLIVLSCITSCIQFFTYKRKIINNPFVGLYSPPFLRKKLVYISALQFCISIGLISSMIIVYMQLNYALQKDLGFISENIINISHGSIGAKQKMLINEISKLPGVVNVSASFGIPGLETTANGYKPEGEEQWQIFSALYVDDNFFSTFQLELIEGRNFREGVNTDTKEFIVNETLAKQLNWNPAVGKSMFRNGNHEIIGVVKDFHVGLIYNKIPPLIISKEGANNFYSLSIALMPGETSQTIKQIKKLWNNIIPDVPFNYFFMNSKFESLYSEIKQTGTILFIFTGISILISILGLFGITFLLINSKVKEIGIRKVNGASVFEIIKKLNYNFLKWFVFAFVIAVPISWYAMNRWLQSFAYRVEQSWWIFALAGVFALSIIILTVSLQSWRAATRNPVDALRYE